MRSAIIGRILHFSLFFFNLALIMSDPKVTIVGSGNWGSAAARRIALNVMDLNEIEGNQRYNSTVTMWVYEEEVSNVSNIQFQ
jgi:NAD-dependent glycerol-3-phosphate dehydrogenase N-terminus